MGSFDPAILKNLQREKRATGYSSSGNEDPQLHEMKQKVIIST